jgi:hypothetical protein
MSNTEPCGQQLSYKEKQALYMKQWREKNKGHVLAYRLANKERKQVKDKLWKKANPDKIKATAKRHREKHKEEISERRIKYYYDNRTAELKHAKEYRDNNHDKVLSGLKSWREENKDRIADYNRSYRQANKEKLREDFKKWREANPEKAKLLKKAWRENNPERDKENGKRWRGSNPDACRANWGVRRARKVSATVEKFSPREVYERDGWICQLCKKPVDKRLKHPNPLSPSLDHIIPLALGGEHSKKNAHLAHLQCNLRAHTGGIKQTRLF